MGHTESSLNKLNRPAITGVVPRERLFRRIDDSLSRKALWVTSPGGSGKTTLVSGYLESRNLHCLWYQIDQGDADIATFFYFMGQAARRAAPRCRKPLPHFSKEYLAAIQTFSRRYFESLFTRLPRPSVVVFDNFQDAHGDLFHDVVYAGIDAVPEGITVIVGSREIPPTSFARLQANGMIEILGWDQVRFTEEESSLFLRAKGAGELPEDAMRRLHQKTEGWVSGLLLLVEHARLYGVELSVDDAWQPEVIFNYFAAEVLNRMDEEHRAFLLTTSFLPYMPVRLAERLTGNERAGRILEELSRNQYFTTRRILREEVYQYHQLFREFLQTQALETLGRERTTEIRSRAAALLEELGEFGDAVLLYGKAADWQGACSLVLRQAPVLLSQGRDETVRGWMATLPETMVEQSADLLYLHAASLQALNPKESLDRFKRSFMLHRRDGKRTGMFLAWSAVADVAFYLGEYAIQRAWYAVLGEVLAEDQTFPDAEIETRVTLSTFNTMAFTMADHPDIVQWHERAYALVLSDKTGDINQRLMTGVHLWVYYGWVGNFARAAVLADFLGAMSLREGVSDLVRLVIMTDQVLFRFLTGRCEEGLRIAEEAMRLVEKTGIRAFSVHVMGQAASCALSMGDVPTADRLLEQMQSRLDKQISIDVALYHGELAWKAALENDFTTALQHSRIAEQMCKEAGFLALEGICFSAVAEFLWETGAEQEARRMLALGYERAMNIRSTILEYFCLLVDVQMAFGRHDEEAGLGFLTRAFGLAGVNGFVNKYIWRPKVMADLCARALEAGIETEYVQKLIRLRNLTVYPPSTAIEAWPWPIKVYTLGRFELLVNGDPVRFSGKAQKKPLEMLKALVALGGAEAREGQIADFLWPDTEGDTSRSSVKITLHRLRDLLGSDKAVPVREGRLSLDRRLVWADAWAFDSLLQHAQVDGESGEEAAAVRSTEQALALYQGHFLVDEANKGWATSRRKRLKSRFILHVVALGSLWQAKGELHRAIACYLKGLEVDDLAEELYQKLMETYLAAGLRGETLTTYQRCKKTLAFQGLSPSPGTVALHKKALA